MARSHPWLTKSRTQIAAFEARVPTIGLERPAVVPKDDQKAQMMFVTCSRYGSG
jgi:hypothetical protein